MTTKTTKASKKTTTLHIAIPGSGKPICGASGKGIKTTLTAAEANCADCQKIAAHAEEKAKNEAKAPKAEKPEVKKAEKPAAEPRERDPRLPPPGTVIKKLDRHGGVRAELKVTEAGFIYRGEEFRSLSAAAMAAAKDLGIKGAVNGWIWWGITKQATKILDPVDALDAAWVRFFERVKVIAAGELEAPVKMKISNALDRQGREILELGATL
jgi:hypothetical protein